MWAIAGLLATAVMLVIKPYAFNAFIDVVVPIHTIAAIAAILFFFKTLQQVDDNSDVDNRKFTFKKKSKGSNDPLFWRSKFDGKFDMVKRPGFKEYLLKCGVSSFPASIASGRPRTMIFERDPANANRINISSVGVPPFAGCWMTATEKEEDAPVTDVVDGDKKSKFRLWWNDSEQELMLGFEQTLPDGTIQRSRQIRKFVEDDMLYYKCFITVPNDPNTEVFYEEWLKQK